MSEWYYLNGNLYPSHREAVLPQNRGLLYGDGLFETIRVYRGKPFLLDLHLERMLQGAEILELNMRTEKKELEDAVMQVIKANNLTGGWLRITLTRGTGAKGLWPSNNPEMEATTMITAGHGAPYSQEQYRQGFRAALVSFPRNENSPVVKLKSLNFLENILGRREAQKKGANEGLFVNQKGNLTEGTVSNLFATCGSKLFTPPPEDGLLAGITRNLVIELAKNQGLEVIEESFTPYFLLRSDEAFLTNSLVEIISLVEVDDIPIGNGKPGELSLKLHHSYQDYTEKGI